MNTFGCASVDHEKFKEQQPHTQHMLYLPYNKTNTNIFYTETRCLSSFVHIFPYDAMQLTMFHKMESEFQFCVEYLYLEKEARKKNCFKYSVLCFAISCCFAIECKKRNTKLYWSTAFSTYLLETHATFPTLRALT